MKIHEFSVVVSVFLLLLASANSYPCTTFCFQNDGEWVFGRNYDWDVEGGLIFVNKRGVAKIALSEGNPAKWISRYGSITFNQYGRELPLGGMNEAGLVIECMSLEQTEYPHPDSRPGLPELQWIQYHLDTAASVEDYALSVLDQVAVERTVFGIVYDVKNGRIHYRTKSNPHVRFVDFNDLDYSCRTPVKVLDLALDGEGEMTGRFSDYTYEANYVLIRKSFTGTKFLKDTPENIMQMIARYPENLPCAAP